MNYDTYQILENLVMDMQKTPHTLKPTDYFAGRGVALLTSMILFYLKSEGHYAQRSMQGNSDIVVSINGKSVFIDINFWNDIQSDAHIRFQKSVEDAGGRYLTIKSFDEFLEIYQNLGM